MPRKIIRYDSACPMCSALVRKIDKSSQKESFSLQGDNQGKEIIVSDAGGRNYYGIEGILQILETYPRWRWLAFIGKLPIIKQILSLGYKLVAVNRHRLFS